MSNFFFTESSYSFSPVLNSVDDSVVTRDINLIREKIVDHIRQLADQKELSATEVSFATRMPKASVAPILKGKVQKISTDKLLRVARLLGLKPQIKFKADS